MTAPACLVCEAPGAVRVDALRWRCRPCGFVFVDTGGMRRLGEYADVYAGDAGHAIDEGRRPLYASLLASVPPFGNRRCLDVGAALGLFPRIAAAAGWRAVGIDSSGPSHEGEGYRLLRADFPMEGGVPGAPFALVTFLGSLMYMHDPVAALRAAHEALEPGGLVVVRVPNVTVHLPIVRAAARLGARPRAAAWVRRWAIVHPRAFSARALAVALTRAGFAAPRIVASPPVPGDPYGSGAFGMRTARAAVAVLTRAVSTGSGGRLLWAPSLEGRAVRGGC